MIIWKTTRTEQGNLKEYGYDNTILKFLYWFDYSPSYPYVFTYFSKVGPKKFRFNHEDDCRDMAETLLEREKSGRYFNKV